MKIISIFNTRLQELLSEKGKTYEEMAEAIGVARATAYRWKNEPLEIVRKNLIAVADYFECTLDFLVGMSDDPRKVKPVPCPEFSEHVRIVMRESGFSTYTLRKETRFDNSYFRRWKLGQEPGLGTLLELCEIFDCTLDHLVGRDQ